MKRFFTILEGQGKGETRPVLSARAIIGRSSNADIKIEDPAISRRHLEIRVEGDTVFIENASNHGSLLNGKPLTSVVSLNPGDVLQLGQTQLRYEESTTAILSSERKESVADESEIDGTRVADSVAGGGAARQDDDEEKPDATHAAADDRTRIANEQELKVVFKEQQKQKAAARKSFWLILILIVVVAGAGGAFWFMQRGDSGEQTATIGFKDSIFGYSIEYPANWSKTSGKPGLVEIGIGNESGDNWARVRVRGEKAGEHAHTGLTYGFTQYQDVLKKQFSGFELTGSKTMEVNNATVIFFGFGTPTLQGKGMYLLNAETRLVFECSSPRTCYLNYTELFGAVLQSLHLTSSEGQQWIDFPPPDGAMQQLALANPSVLNQQVAELTRRGAQLMAAKDVKVDNVFRGMQEYRRALQLAVAGPERADGYAAAAEGLLYATKLYNRTVQRYRFEISRALGERDRRGAWSAALNLMQAVPDKTDPAYQYATEIARQTKPAQ